MYVRDKDERELLEQKARSELHKRTSACELLLQEYNKTITNENNWVLANKEKMRRLRLTITDMLKDIEAITKEFDL